MTHSGLAGQVAEIKQLRRNGSLFLEGAEGVELAALQAQMLRKLSLDTGLELAVAPIECAPSFDQRHVLAHRSIRRTCRGPTPR